MKYVLALLISITTASWAVNHTSGISAREVQRVYNNLARSNPQVRKVSISVQKGVYSWCSLACNTGNQIIVSEEALDYIQNTAELAGIIGHELAHFVYKDEKKADILGLQYAHAAGYRWCVAAQFLKGLEGDLKHPSGEIRYRNTGCP